MAPVAWEPCSTGSCPRRRRPCSTWAAGRAPEELDAELRAAGFAVEPLLAVEGVGAVLTEPDAWLDDPDRRGALLRAIARVETEPALLGMSPHILAVGRKLAD